MFYVRRSEIYALIYAGLPFLTIFPAKAVGFRLPNQDPEGIARGNAFVATADNPAAIYYNPAGITQLEGHQVRVGIYAISTSVEHTAPNGEKSEIDTSFQPVPQFHYVVSPKDWPVSFGLGVYAPFGLSIDWGNDTPFRSLAEEGELLYLTFNPVIAWQIHPTLSIGIGPHISYSEAEFKQGLFVPGDQFRFDGDDVGYSFSAGVRWQPHEQWAFGASYRHSTTMDYEGEVSTSPSSLPPFLPPFLAGAYFSSMPAGGSIRFPRSVDVGVSYRPTPNWNIEANLDWTDWDNLNSITFQGVALPPIVLNYESSFMYEFGVTRRIAEKYFVSAGYIFSENSSPDAGFHPLIPDADLHLGSVGFSYRGERWGVALGYHFAYNSGRTVSGSPLSITGASADGEYEVLNHAVNVAATFRF